MASLFSFEPFLISSINKDDIFPPTRVAWEPLCSAHTWLQASEPDLRYVSLQPEGMPSLSGNTSVRLASTGGGEPKRKSVEEKNNMINASMNNSLNREQGKEANRDITKVLIY